MLTSAHPTPGAEGGLHLRILIAGGSHGSLEASLQVLQQKAVVHLVPVPEVQHALEGVTGTASVLLVSSDIDPLGFASIKRRKASHGLQMPVLLCVPREHVEEEDCYAWAEDFIVVPCSERELEKRVTRLALRTQNSQPSSVLRLGALSLNPQRHLVALGDRPVQLTPLEFQLLKFLMSHPGQVFSREHLLAQVWGVRSFAGTRTVDVHIRRLRQKLGSNGSRWFRTVKNVGYSLVTPEGS
jgi:DNA-binding response OmpR family regulator